METSNLSITFWVYLLEDSTGDWRVLMHKGNSVEQLTPTIMLWPKERRLHVRVSTEEFWNEGLESKGLVMMKQWVHISVIISGQMLQLYINGNLDNQLILKGKVIMNDGKLHLGKNPWHHGVKCYIDDVRIYSTSLRSQDIETEAAAGNPLIGSTYATLGCYSCSFIQAMTSCPQDTHLCNYSELYSGAYLIARKNGWFKFNTEVWARESQVELQKATETEEYSNQDIKKMALCCSDI